MSGPSAGWFPDPMRRHQLRYWNGSEWSEHVADAGQTAVDPVAVGPTPVVPEHHEAHPLPPPTLPTVVTPTAPVAPAAAPQVSVHEVTAAPERTKRRVATWMIVAAILAVAGIAVGAVFVLRSGDDQAATGNEAELFLEPATATGTDSFTPSVDTNTAPPPVRIVPMVQVGSTTTVPSTTVATTALPTSTVANTTPATATTVAGATTPVRSVDATRPGLYGGTRNNQACNAEQMIAFLGENPQKAAAWAGAQGIQAADIPAFIRSLTPVVLRADTRVTNFGFRNGIANPKPAILQAGTAVFVDQYGIPRARCSCGNPLAPPRPLPAGYTYRGDPWPGFDPTTVIVVVNVTNVVINDFVIVDLNGGYFGRTPAKSSPTGIAVDGPVFVDSLCDMVPDAPECLPPVETTLPPETTQPEPVLGTGDVQFTLRWSSTADLDLAVLDPNNEEINFDSPLSSSGGQLDVDSNSDCASAVTNPVENVFWPAGQSLDGVYKVQVRYYDECGSGVGPQSFTLTAVIDGVEVALQPLSGGIRASASDSLNAPRDVRTYELTKTAGPPIAVDTTVAPTTPPTTAGPGVTTPSSRVPVDTAAPVGSPPTTAAAGQAIPLDEYCAQLYPPPGPLNMYYTLCMHDPTVN